MMILKKVSRIFHGDSLVFKDDSHSQRGDRTFDRDYTVGEVDGNKVCFLMLFIEKSPLGNHVPEVYIYRLIATLRSLSWCYESDE